MEKRVKSYIFKTAACERKHKVKGIWRKEKHSFISIGIKFFNNTNIKDGMNLAILSKSKPFYLSLLWLRYGMN